MSATDFKLRPLSYPDLPRVIAIERRCFPLPWSLSMFVLDLSDGAERSEHARIRDLRPL
jgi:hypothetical protein